MKREPVFVSGRWVCEKYGIGYRTLMDVVDAVGEERAGRVVLPGMKNGKFVRSRIEAVLMGGCEDDEKV